MGLAVVFGSLVMDWQWSIPVAILATLFIGCVGGALNGLLVAEFKIPPLIVTLAPSQRFEASPRESRMARSTTRDFRTHFFSLGRLCAGSSCAATNPADRDRRVRAAAASFGDRKSLVRDRIRRERSAVRGDSRRQAHWSGIYSCGLGVERCRHHLCRASRPGEVGCGHRL